MLIDHLVLMFLFEQGWFGGRGLLSFVKMKGYLLLSFLWWAAHRVILLIDFIVFPAEYTYVIHARKGSDGGSAINPIASIAVFNFLVDICVMLMSSLMVDNVVYVYCLWKPFGNLSSSCLTALRKLRLMAAIWVSVRFLSARGSRALLKPREAVGETHGARVYRSDISQFGRF